MKVNEAAEKFLTDLAMVKSGHTVSSYRTALNHLCSCCGDRDVSEVTAGIVPEFVRWLSDNNPVAQNTLNLYLVALSRFYEWLVLSDLTEEQVLQFRQWVKRYHHTKGRRSPKIPDEGHVQALLECIRGSRPTPVRPDTEAGRNMTASWLRDRALVETLRSTGCRIEEACSLPVGAFSDGYACVVGKGDKERVLFWDDVGREAVKEYLDFKAARPTDPLFARHDWKAGQDTPLSTNAARHVLAEWCRSAHVPVITPHQFRHRFATASLRSMKLEKVQDLMGHASPTTTRIYTVFSRDELGEAHASAQY